MFNPTPKQRAGPGPRSKVLAERITGKITDWKGRFGWIVPDKPVSHADAAKHGGKIYLSQQDVDAEIEGIGSVVSFFVYADGTGLGAMSCRPATEVELQPKKTIEKLAPLTAKAPPPASAKAGHKVSDTLATGGYGANAAWASAAAAAWMMASGKGGPPGGARPDGRTPVKPDQQFKGHIKDWKGAYGWIISAEPLYHPLYKGQLYLGGSDLVDGSKNTIKKGDAVVFKLYTDHQGLGAEKCRIDTSDGAGSAEGGAAEESAWGSEPAAGGAGGAWGGREAASAVLRKPAQTPATAKAAASRPPGGPRKRLTTVEATGEVLEWNGTSGTGWLRCHEVFEHEAAEKNDGKVYVSRMDVAGKLGLQVGALVQFHVSADKNGLLAEAVKPF